MVVMMVVLVLVMKVMVVVVCADCGMEVWCIGDGGGSSGEDGSYDDEGDT